MSYESMRRMTKQAYSKLPEIVQKKEEEKK